ncbi:MAG: hypothetical protein B6U89_06700 [Desulfurococcales archaeon ex4484_58]|nr:MAG: hypothetical protein B6U89_06700 [Desulfurococcales archaeon ex4484_58]
MYRPSRIDDKIILIRGLAGIFYSILAYSIYRLNLTLPFMDLSMTIWFLAGIIYIATAMYIQSKYRVNGLFQLFIRGLLTYYGSWILLFLILYDLLG